MSSIIAGVVRAVFRRTGRPVDRQWDDKALRSMAMAMLTGITRGFIRGLSFRSATGPRIIKKGVILRNTHHLTVGKQFIAEEYCEINALSKRGVVFGDRVSVGAYALIRPTNYYGGELGEGLKVGNNSNIGPFSYIGCSGYVEIGDNVMISPRVSIYAENHVIVRTDVTMKSQGVRREFVKIEDDCWIAANSVILAGVTVGKGSVVAAGSVVTKDVPPYAVVGGVPARVIMKRNVRKRK